MPALYDQKGRRLPLGSPSSVAEHSSFLPFRNREKMSSFGTSVLLGEFTSRSVIRSITRSTTVIDVTKYVTKQIACAYYLKILVKYLHRQSMEDQLITSDKQKIQY